MSRRLCLLITIVFVLGLALATVAQGADPDLVGWWWFDEGSGTTASDSSRYGNHGTLMSDPQWVPGVFHTALAFDGVDDYVEVPHAQILTVDNEVAVMAWINAERHQGPGGEGWQGILSKSNSPRSYSFYTESGGGLHFSGAGVGPVSTTDVPLNEWVHVCATVIGGQVAFYMNGEDAGSSAAGSLPGAADTATVVIGRTNEGDIRSFLGMMDDVRIYKRGLTLDEVQEIMTGSDLVADIAANPIPEDAVTDVPPDVVLGWTAGASAATHDVYFGTVADDVNNASRANPMGLLVSQGQADTTYDPDGLLEIGQTYFWRVDEVNAAPDNTIFKGTVWSFTAEPVAYPIEGVVATSNAVCEASAGPENTVNGSGLNADDQHSTESIDMFAGLPDGADPIWIQYEFDRVYELHQMLVWNYNVQFELLLGFGVKGVSVEYSTDGVEWTVLGDVEFAQATARPDYVANTAVDFDAVAAKYVRLTVNSAYGFMGKYGLSEVRFMFIPTQARAPQPADGTGDVSVDADLAWRAGRDAVSHEIHFGTDEQAVADGTALLDTVGDNSLTLAPLDLETTYYWKVNEVQEVDSWEGAVWSFSTQAYLVVEDFESYTDDLDAGEAIFQTWIDGWDNDTGSTVGHLNDPFAEQTIVHGGRQSMPLFYDNAGLTTAETEYTFDAQDWTASGIQSLSVFFAGDTGNSGGQLYLKINNARVDYDGDAADITRAMWQPWNIDLSTVGGLANVTKLTIGIEGAGATGIVYIDDIRLYPQAVEYITPTEPDSASLVGRWSLNGNANDGSGNGYNGAEMNGPTYVAGIEGQAMKFDGVDDYVDLGSPTDWPSGAAPRTMSLWATTNSLDPAFRFAVAYGTAGTGQAMFIGINGTTLYGGGYGDDVTVADFWVMGEWHHLGLTYDGTTARMYTDGVEAVASVKDWDLALSRAHIGQQVNDGSEFWNGTIDEVRLYDEALSAAEIAWLAGRTVPLPKPF